MNQRSRQAAKNSVEKDFLKLGYDCCNNLENCRFVPILDELNEMIYLKNCYNFLTITFLNLFRVNYLRGKLTKNLMTNDEDIKK